MAPNPHFISADSWEAAERLVGFRARVPGYTAGYELSGLAVFVRDHKFREVSRAERSLEAHYGSFVLAQSEPGPTEAAKLALETRFGSGAARVTVAGWEGRSFELGPPQPPDDVDGRAPAVVVWAEGSRFFLLASSELDVPVLLRIASSL